MVQGDRERGDTCAELLKVLAEDTRLGILRELMSGPKRVSDINEVLKIEQSLLSHHLKVLREKGFVISERRGKSVFYELAPEMLIDREFQAINLGCCLVTFEGESGESR